MFCVSADISVSQMQTKKKVDDSDNTKRVINLKNITVRLLPSFSSHYRLTSAWQRLGDQMHLFLSAS